jgi:hypothetical protein
MENEHPLPATEPSSAHVQSLEDSLDRELRQAEEDERLQRLSTVENLTPPCSWHSDSPDEPWSPENSELRRLRREHHQLLTFHNAVWNSRPWQWIQILRGLVGRAWPAEIFIETDPSLAGLARLQREVERLAAFRSAVLQSNGWRLVETLRKPLGRRW